MARPIVAGFPDFKEALVQRYSAFFETIPTLLTALNDLTSEGHEFISAEHYVILNLGIVAGVTTMELILLAVNGFGPGAVKAARSLLEASITAEYLRKHPEHYRDFEDYYHVEKYEELAFLKQHLPDSYANLEPELILSLETEMSRVQERFAKRRGWCKHDLAERAKQTDYLESYRLVQPLGSGFVHVSPYGMHRRFDKGNQDRIALPPSMDWIEQSLVSGHTLCLGMVRTLLRCFHPEDESTVFGRLEKDFRRAWPSSSHHTKSAEGFGEGPL